MMRSTSCRVREVAVDSPRLITIVPCIAVTMIVAVLGAPAVAQPTGGTMTFELSSYDAPAGTSVTLDLFLEDAVDVQGYQATIEITRVRGRGEVAVSCPDGVTVDEGRPDYIFSGLDTVYLEPDCWDCGVIVPQCEGMRVAAARVSGGVDTGATRAYLGTFTLDVSEDATPGSAYKISIVPFPASVVTGSDYGPIPFSISPSQILTDDDQDRIPTVSGWGLIVLALLLLTGLKIKFGRRGPKIPGTRCATAGRGGSALRMLVLALVLAGAPSAALGKECYDDADCSDGDVCTNDWCHDRHCHHKPTKPYGDVAGADGCIPDGVVDEFDVSAIEAGAQGIFDPGCSLHNMDIKSSAGHEADGAVDLFDINAVLSAFAGEAADPCKPDACDDVVVTITNINRGVGLPPSIPFRQTSDVAVTIEPSLAGTDPKVTITFDVINSSADNGTGSIDGTNTLQSSGTIKVKGDAQTKPAHSGQLKVRARCDGAQKALSNGFSVCAHPNGTPHGSHSPLNTAADVGMQIAFTYQSDSATNNDLNHAKASEQIVIGLNRTGCFVGTGMTDDSTGFLTAAGARADIHTIGPKASLITLFDTLGQGTFEVHQVHIFYCERCGMVEADALPVPNSGYRIEHNMFGVIPQPNRIDVATTKTGAAMTVNGFASGAGLSGGSETVTIRP